MAGIPSGNLRDKTFDQGMAKNVKSTGMLKGQAHEGADWHSKNETKQYVAPSSPVGPPLGGKNSRS